MTADELVTRIKDVASLPVRADTTDAKILAEINSEFASFLVPMFRKLRGGFAQDYIDIPLVANQAAYAIPTRAINSSVDIIKYLDSSGNEIYEVLPIPIKGIGRRVPYWYLVSETTAAQPVNYYLNPGQIVLTPIPSSATGSLRVYYPRRPGALVLDTTVTEDDDPGTHNSVLTAASDWDPANSTFNINGTINDVVFATGVLIDIQNSKSPFDLRLKDGVINVSGAPGDATNFTVTGITDFSTINCQPGDFATLATKAYVPEIPQEWHELLLDIVVAKFQNKLGNYKGEAVTKGRAKDKLDLLISSTSPRAGMSRGYLNPFS